MKQILDLTSSFTIYFSLIFLKQPGYFWGEHVREDRLWQRALILSLARVVNNENLSKATANQQLLQLYADNDRAPREAGNWELVKWGQLRGAGAERGC